MDHQKSTNAQKSSKWSNNFLRRTSPVTAYLAGFFYIHALVCAPRLLGRYMYVHYIHTSRIGAVLPAKDPGFGFEKHLSDMVDLAMEFPGLEILVIDDGSKDDYVQDVCSKLSVKCIRHATNQGKGEALRTGFNHFLANGFTSNDMLGFIDSDGDIPARFFLDYAKILESRTDLVGVIGAKRLDDSVFESSRKRKIASKVFSVFASFCVPTGTEDTQVGVKIFRSWFIQKTLPFTHSKGFLLDLELLSSAHRNNLAVLSSKVEVSLAKNSSTISRKQVLKMAKDLAVLSFKTRRGRKFAHISK